MIVKKRWLFSLIILLIGVGVIITVLIRSNSGEQNTLTSPSTTKITADEATKEKLPSFVFKDIEGREHTSTDFIGKPMLIIEWASWCPHCQATLPVINHLYQEYQDQVHFIVLNATGSANGYETKEVAQSYLLEKGYSFSSYYDEGMQVADRLNIQSVPTIIIVNKNGEQVERLEKALTIEAGQYLMDLALESAG